VPDRAGTTVPEAGNASSLGRVAAADSPSSDRPALGRCGGEGAHRGLDTEGRTRRHPGERRVRRTSPRC